MSIRLPQILIVLGVVLAVAICAGIIALTFFFQSMFPSVPSYTSQVSVQADEGATRIAVPFCVPTPRLCEGYPRFYRGGRLLMYHDREGIIAFDPTTGVQLWQTEGRFEAQQGLYLTEFGDGAYAYAPSSGQIVDLDDGRIVVQGCGMIGRPRRVRSGLYRVECYDQVFLADLRNGRVAPYAAPGVGVVAPDVLQPDARMSFDPGWHGPVDQTDDGALALWFLIGEENGVAIHSRDSGAEVWRARIAAPLHKGRIHAERGLVLVNVPAGVLAFDLRNGQPVEVAPDTEAFENSVEMDHAGSQPNLEVHRDQPGEWSDIAFDASEGDSIVAHYQVQVPAGGLRWHRGGYWGSDSLEGGARRLIVVRRSDGVVLLERPMEDGPTATAGYRVGIAVSPDGRRVALVPTDGVLRVYELTQSANP